MFRLLRAHERAREPSVRLLPLVGELRQVEPGLGRRVPASDLDADVLKPSLFEQRSIDTDVQRAGKASDPRFHVAAERIREWTFGDDIRDSKPSTRTQYSIRIR